MGRKLSGQHQSINKEQKISSNRRLRKMEDKERSGLHVVFTMILCETTFGI